jgi:lipoate-protein ligase A
MIANVDLLLPEEAYDGPMQMALDEALLRSVSKPTLRVYRWSTPWVTFGYFQEIKKVHDQFPDIPAVRRWTGGGMVDHGEDLTFSLVLPYGAKLAEESPTALYHALHGMLADQIRSTLPVSVELAGSEDMRRGEACFQAPVHDDLLINEAKVLGGALRRSGGGVLYQGSLRVKGVPGWNPVASAASFLADALSESHDFVTMSSSLLKEAMELVSHRYGTELWNHRK